jgi:ssDNA-binding replication factor A large subunit
MTTVSDSSYEILVAELSSRAKLDRDSLLKMIQEKKAKVGAGYLTDQGALFLVASDLGVSVDYDRQRPASLAKLEPELKSVTVIGRMLSLGSPKIFNRKGDSSKGLLSKLFLYDSTTTVTVSLWDGAFSKILEPSLGLVPGALLKITDAYTRAGLDGRPELNVGEKGTFAKIDEGDEGKKIATLENLAVAPSLISEGGRALVVRGKIQGEVKKSGFARTDGTTSTLYSFSVQDELGSSGSFRVVIWGNANPAFEKLHDGDVITLLNVRTKISTFQNSPALEIHGDESTLVREVFNETRTWLLEKSKEFTPATAPPVSEKSPATARLLPFVGRVISKRFSSNDRKFHLLILDSQKRKISLAASEEAVKNLVGEEVPSDSVIICRPDTFDPALLRASCTAANSVIKVAAKRPDIPMASSLFVKVEDIPSEEGAVISLELICLNDHVSREVQTKDGLVKRSELTVADHTGEVKVFGWRNLSKMLEEFSAGDRIILRAVETQIFEGRKFLVLKNYSVVEKKPISG